MLDLYEHLRLIDNMSRIHMYIVYLQERIQDSCTDLCKKNKTACLLSTNEMLLARP